MSMRSEFEFISYIKKKFGLGFIGDDCAVLPKDDRNDLLITADLLVEGVDFRTTWASPHQIGHKALAVSLSDIAAMGGTPCYGVLALGVPAGLWKTDFADEFFDGYMSLAREHGVELAGGDISRADQVVVDSTVVGEVERGHALRRSGASAGDLIYVTGQLGESTGGLKALQEGRAAENLIERHLKPQPRVILAKSLQTLGIVTSMIDISDGLSSDVRHICEASRTGAEISAERLPVSSALVAYFGRDEAIQLALHGGEDFELLFTVRPEHESKLAGLPVSAIGKITHSVGEILIVEAGGKRPLHSAGYEHFSGRPSQ